MNTQLLKEAKVQLSEHLESLDGIEIFGYTRGFYRGIVEYKRHKSNDY
jgi:hypothetical protein